MEAHDQFDKHLLCKQYVISLKMVLFSFFFLHVTIHVFFSFSFSFFVEVRGKRQYFFFSVHNFVYGY